MSFLTKFPRTKLFTVAASLIATAVVWSALAWPDWTAASAKKAYVAPDPQVLALQALAALSPQQLAALAAPTAPPAPAPRQVVHQTVVIKRTLPGKTYLVPDDGSTAEQPQYAVSSVASGDTSAQQQAPAPSASSVAPDQAAAPRSGSAPSGSAPSGSPPPPPPPGQPEATVPAAPAPPAPPPPPPTAPEPTTPPPPPPPTPAPPPKPAPTATPVKTGAS